MSGSTGRGVQAWGPGMGLTVDVGPEYGSSTAGEPKQGVDQGRGARAGAAGGAEYVKLRKPFVVPPVFGLLRLYHDKLRNPPVTKTVFGVLRVDSAPAAGLADRGRPAAPQPTRQPPTRNPAAELRT